MTPNFPYLPLQGRRIKGFDLLADYLWPSATPNVPPPVEFLMLLGDFIYADVPLYFGDDKEAYRRLYRRNYMSKSFRKIYERLRESSSSLPLQVNSIIQLPSIHTTTTR